MMRVYNKSGIYLIAFALVSTGLTGCGATINNAGGSGSSTTLESGSADGTGGSAIASDTDTSVTVTPASGSAWSEFLIDLGAQFTKANICSGKTIFGRVGEAVCMAMIDNRYNDVSSSTKRNISQTGLDDDGYYRKRDTAGYIDGTEAIAKPDLSAQPACGESGTIEERVEDCNFTWNVYRQNIWDSQGSFVN